LNHVQQLILGVTHHRRWEALENRLAPPQAAPTRRTYIKSFASLLDDVPATLYGTRVRAGALLHTSTLCRVYTAE